MISKRMAELAMQVSSGSYGDTLRLAEARGIRFMQEGDLIKFKSTSDEHPPNQASIPTVIGSMYDPVTNFVSLGFAFFGTFWTQVMDVKDVDILWRAKMKNELAKTAAPSVISNE